MVYPRYAASSIIFRASRSAGRQVPIGWGVKPPAVRLHSPGIALVNPYLSRLYRRFFPPRSPRTLSSLAAYDLWAVNYPPHAHNPLMQVEQAAMLGFLPPLSGAAVLDLASGTGRYGLLAREHGAARVIPVDNSPAMLAASPLPCRVQANSEAIPLRTASLDLVICALALGHLPRLQPSLSEIARVLKPAGVALISDVHPFVAFGGGQRTFHAPDGTVFAVEHHTHSFAQYHHAAQNTGLEIDAVAEPTLEGGLTPVVIVFRFTKRVQERDRLIKA